MSSHDEFRHRSSDRADRPEDGTGHDAEAAEIPGRHAQDPEEPSLPTTNQPLNAAPRPRWSPLLAVLALIVVVVLVFAGITWLRYNT